MASDEQGGWAIRAQALSKWHKLYDSKTDRLLESVDFFTDRRYYRKFYALRNVTLQINKGETVGIIGPNGSGKSTLLGCMSGIIHPSSGLIETNGTCAPLLELRAGFNPELTGMENIQFGGELRGLSKDELKRKSKDIIRFADIGEYIDQPVKSYSSGMFVRLAFALNIHLETNILIIDEALAVGDHNFQSKCMTAIRMAMDRGTTILIVSHDMNSIRSLCDRVIYLKGGEVIQAGDPKEVTYRYQSDMQKSTIVHRGLKYQPKYLNSRLSQPESDVERIRKPQQTFIISEEFERKVSALRKGSGGAMITYMDLTDKDGNSIRQVRFDQEVVFHVHFKTFSHNIGITTISILDQKKNILTHANFEYVDAEELDMQPGGCYIVSYRMRLPLGDGIYSCESQIWTKVTGVDSAGDLADSVTDALVFRMYSDDEMMKWASTHVAYSLEVIEIGDVCDDGSDSDIPKTPASDR